MDKKLLGLIIVGIIIIIGMIYLANEEQKELDRCVESSNSMNQCFNCCRNLKDLSIVGSFDKQYCYEECDLGLRIKDFA